jgi:phospholipid/cholesterol/gamma-HCH transport system substrate-binding protein
MKRNSRARSLMTEMIVGGFMVLVFVGLVYFTIILSREAWFQKKYRLEVVFQNVMGLRAEDSVVVRGMPVGKVESLALTADGVLVTARLDKPVRPRRDYKITVVATSILGGRYLEVDEGSAGEPEMPEGTVCKGIEPRDLMADAAEVAAAVRRAFVDGGVLDNLTETVQRLREVADSVSAGRGMLGKMLSDDETLYKDVSSTFASLKAVSARIEKGEGTLGRLLSSDDRLYQDLSATAASLKAVAARLEEGQGTLGRLLSSDDALYRDLTATAVSMKNIAGKIERGEGVMGRLLTDDELYDDLKATVREIRSAVDDFRENTPVVTFTSILFGAL